MKPVGRSFACASFSALQRAENSSMLRNTAPPSSRNCFSALQRAENSSIRHRLTRSPARYGFQCSSASRKFLNGRVGHLTRFGVDVSVLFSEPKIPQLVTVTTLSINKRRSFSALQRAENSSMCRLRSYPTTPRAFQCSSASRKFLN